ncbi:MAG: hypothetical protein R6X34_22855 [Chloroflexota bacterium]
MLKNGSFSNGWTDMPPAPGHLINQQPKDWTLRWIEPGESLFGAGDKAQGVPECVHKLSDQLPPNERLGGPSALILAGNATYKIFNAGAAFGAELKQTVTGLKPGSQAKVTAPVLADLHGETDPFGAESGLWVNGVGRWANSSETKNRTWFHHTATTTVTPDGKVEIVIRVKSKWPRPKDFFIDGIELQAEADPTETIVLPDDDEVFSQTAVTLHVPAALNLQIVTTTCHTPGVVVISVPEGVTVEFK